MIKTLVAFVTACSLLAGANAARVCGTGTSATYPWKIGDARYDSADPSKGDGLATVAISVSPGTTGTLFECNSQWKESWAGWYQGGNNIIWSDCIWTGNGPTQDTTVSFALDWTNRTMYLSHTFNCSDTAGSDALAMGTSKLDMNCTTGADSVSHCALKKSGSISASMTASHLSRSTACAYNSTRYESWQLENWSRSYEMSPGSADPGSTTPPPKDSGPSFVLRNMAGNDVFSCATTVKGNDTFHGACNLTSAEQSATTADFNFDPEFDMLTVTQHWTCSDSSSIDAVGVGYIQAGCDMEGDLLVCTSKPLWVGTETFP